MRQSHPTSAMAVANWFIGRSNYQCDQMKLYKLVYYTHAWYLGNRGEELFAEDIQAWQHGPVIPELYSQFRQFGRQNISTLGTRIAVSDSHEFITETPEHDGSLSDFFENMWENYGQYTGIQLSNATHADGEPWTVIAKKNQFDLSGKPTIPTEIIRDVFSRKVNAPA